MLVRITGIETFPVRHRLREPYGACRGLTPARSGLIVRVRTDEGLVGSGEAWGTPELLVPHVELLTQIYRGQDPFDSEVLWTRAVNGNYFRGNRGALITALSGIDIALWDLMGKATGRPACKLLGGAARTRLLAYASTGYIRSDPFDLHTLQGEAEAAVAEGFRAIKIKIGTGRKGDVARVELVRRIAGDSVLLMVDANACYTAAEAIAVGRALEPYDIHWFEEPVPPEDLQGYAAVSQALDMAVAGGEVEFTRFNFRELISQKLLDIVQVDVCRCGGLGEARNIARMAQAWNLPLVPHAWTSGVGIAATLQFAASLPTYPYGFHEPVPPLFEYDRAENPLRDQLLQEPFALNDGWNEVPQGPGLGVTLDEERLLAFGR